MAALPTQKKSGAFEHKYNVTSANVAHF